MLTKEITNIFQKNKKFIIAAIGNELRSDDAIGPYIAEKLKNIKNNNFVLINCENKPENIIDEVINLNPEIVVFIDAADFNGYPGEIKLIKKESLTDFTLSTHIFPMSAIAKIIEDDANAEVYFICIQVKSVAFGESICSEVLEAADNIVTFLSNVFRND